MSCRNLVFALLCCTLLMWPSQTSSPVSAADYPLAGELTLVPASMKLVHRRQPHSILALGKSDQLLALDLTAEATYASSNEQVATVDPLGWVHPQGTGTATITVTAGGKSGTVAVEVSLPDSPRPHSFRDEVMPVLSKAGCNQGACHGYSLGKNGFKLSLRGSDPDDDVQAITEEYLGRRINRHQPEASLLLTKPLGEAPHKGGIRFERESLLHQLMLSWIREGALRDPPEGPKLESVSIFPEKVVLAPQMQHQLQLLAHYSDGSVRDVTRLGIFTVNTEMVAEVTDEGLASALALGETAIVARFERIFAATTLIVLDPNPSFQPTPAPDGNLIDRHVITKLNDLKITPSPVAGDEEFLRRVHLDLIGIQPTPDEIREFVASEDPNKRLTVVDRLFTRPEFVDRWSLKWGDLLQNSRASLSSPQVFAFREWIRSAVAENMPLDEFARQLITAHGSMQDDPAAAFLAISGDTDDTLQRVTQVFCGVKMLCAKCHAHPFENWTQADYYGLHSFFNQVTTKVDQRQVGQRNAKVVLVNRATGLSRNPRSGQLQPARYLGGVEPELPKEADRREDYARWLTAPENPFFARSMTNRIWSYFFSRGMIHPVDDIRTTNPPTNPELLEALTADFVEHKFDIRHLMRQIVSSDTYQRTCVPNESNQHDTMNFSHSIPRRLSAEAMLDSLVQATGVAEAISGAPGGFTATQLPDPQVKSQFLDLFGKPQRMEACECERDGGSNMLQALHFINGPSILNKVAAGNGRIALLQRAKLTDEQIVSELYLWTVCRQPSAEEMKVSLNFIQSYEEKRTEALQDLMWALLNSRDFTLVN